jgi:hypothetical protein
LNVEQPLGGVVDHGDEGLALLRAPAQPGMPAAVKMQQFPEARPGLAAAAMAAPRPSLADQAGLLQRELHEAIGQVHVVVAPGEAIEVAHVPAAEALPVEPQDPLHLGRGGLPPRRTPGALVVQGDGTARLVSRPPAPHAAGMQAENVGRLQPRDRSTQGLHQHFLQLHRPLHRGRGEDHRHLLGCLWL